MLPWEGQVVAGTTDLKCDVTFDPEPTEKEIDFILDQIKKYLAPNVNGKDIFDNFTFRSGCSFEYFTNIRSGISDGLRLH